MYSVILCGGSGTRLWPLSRKNYPKQFLKLYSNKSLLQETFLRISKIIPKNNIFFVANKSDFYNVVNQIREVYPNFSEDRFLEEPEKRNTAPAIALSVKYLKDKIKIDQSKQIIFLPADHYITNQKKYLKVVKDALTKNNNNIGTIGITPVGAETGYGYIKKMTNGKKNKLQAKDRKNKKINKKKSVTVNKVLEFKEKPDKKTAEKYVKSGDYLWNAGMYVFNCKTFFDEIKKYSPVIFENLKNNYDVFIKNFRKMPNISIDYALSEKSKKVVVFEGDFGWSDIGSFDNLAEVLLKKEDKNKKHIKVDSNNVFIHSTTNKLIATMGVRDLIVVENNDSILIQKRGQSEKVKDIVELLKKNNYKEIDHNVIVHSPWGKYEVLIDGRRHKVRKVTIYPGKKIKLQMHYHRAEHWVVVKGTAEVIYKRNKKILVANESVFIPPSVKHQIKNPGKINLEIIEVQTGNYLGADDVIEF